MKQSSFLAIAFAGMIALLPMMVHAADAMGDLIAAVQVARDKGVAIFKARNKEVQQLLLEEVNKATQDVDNKVAAVEADPVSTEEMKVRMGQFKIVWEEFLKTRDQEIIPAVLAGKAASVKNTGATIQTQRLRQMFAILQGREPLPAEYQSEEEMLPEGEDPQAMVGPDPSLVPPPVESVPAADPQAGGVAPPVEGVVEPPLQGMEPAVAPPQ